MARKSKYDCYDDIFKAAAVELAAYTRKLLDETMGLGGRVF